MELSCVFSFKCIGGKVLTDKEMKTNFCEYKNETLYM